MKSTKRNTYKLPQKENMKKLITLIALLCTVVSYGQPFKSPTVQTFSNPNYWPTPYIQVGQMLDITNSYYYLNVTPFVKNSFKDTTTTGTATKYLYVAIRGTLASPTVAPVSAVDTFVPCPIYGVGVLSFMVSGIKVSGTPAGSITVEQSPDGLVWSPVHTSNQRILYAAGVTAPDTLVINSGTAIQAYSWDYPVKYMAYYRLNISTTGTETSSWRAWYCFTAKL